jgi:hypothetical protein
MELDIVSKKGNPSKDKINQRQDKGLCFKCGLPGHQAASYKKGNSKGKGKPWKKHGHQINATGRTQQ